LGSDKYRANRGMKAPQTTPVAGPQMAKKTLMPRRPILMIMHNHLMMGRNDSCCQELASPIVFQSQ